MRSNDLGLIAIVLLLGILMGVVGTVGVYGAVASRQTEAEQTAAEETVKKLQEERDELQSRINDYLQAEQGKRQAMEQGVGEQTVQQPAPAKPPQAPAVAAAPPTVAAAPQQPPALAKNEEAEPPAPSGFGPPREPGVK